eukprot:5946201-Prymnesium_polylepis.1
MPGVSRALDFSVEADSLFDDEVADLAQWEGIMKATFAPATPRKATRDSTKENVAVHMELLPEDADLNTWEAIAEEVASLVRPLSRRVPCPLQGLALADGNVESDGEVERLVAEELELVQREAVKTGVATLGKERWGEESNLEDDARSEASIDLDAALHECASPVGGSA